MSTPTPAPAGFVSTSVTARVGGFSFSFLRPTDWHVAGLPDEAVDFAQAAVFAPVCVAIASYGALVFSVGVRPAYDDGSVAQWLAWAAAENGCDPGPIEHEQLGPLAAVACWGMQRSAETILRARLAMLEDGGRLIQVAVMAPQAMWLGVHEMLRTMLQSFTLDAPRGAQAPRTVPGFAVAPSTFLPLAVTAATPSPPVASGPPRATEPAAAGEAVAGSEPGGLTYADAALDSDAATFAPEHPQNARMRDLGIGFVPRVARADDQARWAELASGALVALLRVPFGWFALDDGRRLLVYEPAGAIQINLDRRERGGCDDGELLARVQQELQQQWPLARFLRLRVQDMECLGVRDAVVDGETIEQAYLLRAAPAGQVLVVRVTATPETMTRALDVAELVVRDLQFLGAGAAS